jgi:hypothetical protein
MAGADLSTRKCDGHLVVALRSCGFFPSRA